MMAFLFPLMQMVFGLIVLVLIGVLLLILGDTAYRFWVDHVKKS